MKMLRRAPYRCRSCKNRFYVFVPDKPDPNLEEASEPHAETAHKPDGS